MRPYIDACKPNHGGFPTDYQTLRVGALAVRSPASHEAIAHPLMMQVVGKRVLAEQRLSGSHVQLSHRKPGEGKFPWILSNTQIIDVGPGSARQQMHTGNG